jgi:low-affinity ferrous iron transport protein
LTSTILIAWAIVGIVLGAPQNWQIAMQDGSSIQCYISDSLLMRQQQNNCHELLTVLVQLQSRNASYMRMLRALPNDLKLARSATSTSVKRLAEENPSQAINLPTENWFDVSCNWISLAVGSIYALIIYWSGVIAWIGLGPMLSWGNLWQLYVNTATAVELTFTSMFLQNTRRRHMDYLEKCLASIIKTDCEIELRLRQLTGDIQPNPTLEIESQEVDSGVRLIDYYADLIGSGAGVFISICVFIIWIAIGNYMQWNSNWWLIIGTYTGLVGFVDGFVLRNVYFREDQMLNTQFNALINADMDISQALDLHLPHKHLSFKKGLIHRMSRNMGILCSKPEAVLGAVVIVVVLLCIASGMQWSETAQLLCNTPTMIIEGFLLIVLVQAHNMAHSNRRVQLRGVLLRRLALLDYVKQMIEQAPVTPGKTIIDENISIDTEVVDKDSIEL